MMGASARSVAGTSGSGRRSRSTEVSGQQHVPRRVVALDGPAGSGKSTVARLTASRLGWSFVDTGATYRAVTLAVLQSGADLDDSRAVVAAATSARVELVTDPEHPAVLLDGTDVSRQVRGSEVTGAVSAVSALPEVRSHLLQLQRDALGHDGAVAEGRDIATVVAPDAAVKVYLDARPEVRAQRRAHEVGTDRAQVLVDLARRDGLDAQTNALKASAGAVRLDTSDLSLEQVVDAVVALVRQAGL